jgi:hypothetical protein
MPATGDAPAGADIVTLASAEAVALGVPCAQAAIPPPTPTATASAANVATSLLIMLFGRRRARIGCSSAKRGWLASGYA